MQFRDLEYFYVIAEQGNIGRAAEALGLSPTALSKSLRRLEESVHTKLVRRTPTGVTTTPEGAVLLSHVRRLRQSLDDVRREVIELGEGRASALRICAHPALVADLLAPACEELLRQAPKVTLSVTTATTDVAIPEVRNGGFDLAVSTIPRAVPPDLRVEALFDDHVVVFASADHPLARKRVVSLDEVVSQRWVLTTINASPGWDWLNAAFQESSTPIGEATVRTSSLVLRDHLVMKASFLGFISRRFLANSDRLVEIRVKGLDWKRQLGVTYRLGSDSRPIVRRMIDILRAQACRIADGTSSAPSAPRAR